MQVSGTTGAGDTAQLYQLGATTTRTTELQVTTAEGDRVTLSTSSTRSVGYGAATASSAGTSLAAAVFRTSGSDRVTLSVEGNLSKEELHDLAKIIKAFQRAAARGDARKLLHRLGRPDLDTIATVSASARTETSITSAVASVAARPAPPPPAPESEPAAEQLAE
jgi:hypothetical protein